MKNGRDIDVGRAPMVDLRVAAILRAKSGMERLRLAHEAWEVASTRLSAYLADRYPQWSPEQLQAAVAKRLSRDSG